ncbi:MAG: RsmE family RNA methyltransferase, partial [Actinomycetota bacterium]
VEVAPVESPVTVGFVPVKGERPEWVVQKLTEIGVDRIVVARSARSVVRWDGDRADRQLDRLRRVAREAAMQSRRCRLPDLDGVRPVADLLDRGDVAVAAPGGETLDGTERTVLVGPEGGWDGDELSRSSRAVSLGPGVLRAETACVVGAALLVGFRDGRLRPTTNSG